ncbi:MAG: thiamine pyrophosphate-binding protein [Chromatiales bacterium]|nr:thiamine pyrophosphate-binding protein [Chromatiales bacterium]
MDVTVSELIVKFMQRLGIDTIFGMPGAHILPVYDSLYDSPIQSVLVKHEQGAAFMAGGYARASGRIGACITTAGPGATNLVTGIANAYADKLPVLVITGETSTHIFGKGGLQESSGEGGSIDQITLFKGITRYNRIVERTDYLAQTLNRAARILLSPNPGPVLLSFPFNVQSEWVDESILDEIVTSRSERRLNGASLSTSTIAEKLLAANYPVIVAGHGAIRSGAQQQLTQLSEQLAIPVASSLKAKGVIDEQSPLALGSLGVTSSGHAYKYLVEHADLILFLGASFNERTSYLWERQLLGSRTLIQIDNDPEQLSKVFQADIAVQGEINEVLHDLLQRLDGKSRNGGVIRGLVEQLKGDENNDYAIFQSGFSLVRRFFTELESHFPRDAVVFDDNIIFAQNFFQVSSANRYHPNSGVSSLGHAIPAAIGARFAETKPTFAILGDGGFQMCCMELMTAVNYQIPINVVLFNNSTMGLIRKNQHQHYQGRYINCDFINPDFAALARSFGIHYRKLQSEEDVAQMFVEDDLRGGINLIEMVIDKDKFPNYSSRR